MKMHLSTELMGCPFVKLLSCQFLVLSVVFYFFTEQNAIYQGKVMNCGGGGSCGTCIVEVMIMSFNLLITTIFVICVGFYYSPFSNSPVLFSS